MANELMRTSAKGLARLRFYEGVRSKYYEDQAGNCTVGVGQLVRHGLCTPEEKGLTASDAQIEQGLAQLVRATERTVQKKVSRQQLTQDQFDALVTHCFNMGPTGSRTLLDAANRGAYEHVVRSIRSRVFYRPLDRMTGKRLAPKKSAGLVRRRQEEAAPFLSKPLKP